MNVAIPLDFPMDTLREMVNAGMERAASSLNLMLNTAIELEIPSVALFKQDDLANSRKQFNDSSMSSVRIRFGGPVTGDAYLVFSPPSRARLVAALTGQETPLSEMNALMAETLKEVGNVIINGVIGTIGNILKQTVELSIPVYLEGRLSDLLRPETHPASLTILLLVRARFRSPESMIDGTIFLIFEVGYPGATRLQHNALSVQAKP
jgi:chemotaxis protein CheC